jgi:D-inositol-3-phosphate glycosyltransferase
MKILFILENYYPHIGGVEIIFQNLCEGLAKLGHDVRIITHRLKNTKKYEVLNGVKINRISCLKSRYLFTFFAIPSSIKFAKKYDMIHTTTFNGAFPAWLASKRTKKKCMITIHEVWIKKWYELTEMNYINAKIHDILESFIYLLKFDKYITVSNSTKKQLEKIKVKKEKIKVIHNGVDYNHWNPKKYDGKKVRKQLNLENNFIYLFSGRPGVSKGLEYLIKAVPLISKLIPNSKLLAIVSKDKDYKKRYEYIKKLIKQLKIERNVILHDPVPYKELPNYIKAADCIVVPSLAEGFGFAAAEACAMGKPVVASNTTSLPEVVSGKYVLVKTRSPDGISKGVEMVYNNKTIKTPLKKFLLKTNIEKHVKLYNQILK